jgi:transglutaminase-like putative cysteine protease
LQASLDGAAHEAAHAWAEIYIQGFGWIGFDPANRCCPDARYIRLGSGLDAQDAAPIRGISRAVAAGADVGENLSVTVAIAAQEQ